MTISIPDFSAFTPIQFASVLLIVAVVDLVTGVFGALRAGTFSFQQLPTILESHGVNRIIPIGGLFAIGVLGATPALCFAADAALAAYVVETVQSAWANVQAPAAAS